MSEVRPADEIAIIGAGIIGCALAWALSHAGRGVLLIDRAEPASAGASFGNVGHIATEQLQPLPSPALLRGFWRELTAFDGPLELPARRLPALAPWMVRFAQAAFRQDINTRSFAPLVRVAADSMQRRLAQIGRADLMQRRGHFVVWLGKRAQRRATLQLAAARELQLNTVPIPADTLRTIALAAGQEVARAAGLWYADSAHVLDPALVARAFAAAAIQHGAGLRIASVRHMQPQGDYIAIITGNATVLVRSAVICAGAWSAPFLRPFGLHAPLEAERGYHVELPGHEPLAGAPILYAEHNMVVTPMTERLRASGFLEFAGLDAPADPRKPARLRARLRELGYRADEGGPEWMGPRPTLPDYLPGLGRAPGPHSLYYAIGHQHLGLTLSAVSGDLMADLIGGVPPGFDLSAFDLQRFGRP